MSKAQDEKLIYHMRESAIARSRKGLLAFTLHTKPEYKVNWHHKLLCQKLNAFARGEIRYLMVFMPPRHGKSELVSRRLPAYLHGIYPDSFIMAASYSDSLATDMTADVQKIIDSPEYAEVFPGTKIPTPGTRDPVYVRNSSEHHIIHRLGKYIGQGVGGSFTGKGAQFVLIDDPIKGREAADSNAFREKLWNFWVNDLFSRLETDITTGRPGQVLITLCMTGDTPVLMADGTETQLRHIKIGDAIATYENGHISVSTIKQWKCNGPDFVFKIRTSSGRTVKANERHPFLVCRDWKLEWVRLRDLKVNDKMIRAGVSGQENYAHLMDANLPLNARGFVCPTTTRLSGHPVTDPHQSITNLADAENFDIDTESSQKTTIKYLESKTGNARFAKVLQRSESTCHPIGKKCASTTVTLPGTSEDFSVTSATSLLNTEILKKYYSGLLSTYEFTLDTIVEITEVGYEDVFDIQVDRTENFIANGLVSHNTRWHEDDLAGRLITQARENPLSAQFEILSLPAIRSDGSNEEDPRKIGEALWPIKYSEDELKGIKATAGTRTWTSLYQQNPTPNDGYLVKREWVQFYETTPDVFEEKIIVADLTFKETQQGDFTVIECWGRIGTKIYLIDQIRGRMNFPDQMSAIRRMSRNHPDAYAKYIEEAANGAALIEMLKNEIMGLLPYKPMTSKEARIATVSPLMEAGNVYWPSEKIAPWVEVNITELLSFPNAKNDDCVDCLSLALLKLGKMISSMNKIEALGSW